MSLIYTKAYLDEQLRDPEFKAEYDALEPEFKIVRAMIDAQLTSGLYDNSEHERIYGPNESTDL